SHLLAKTPHTVTHLTPPPIITSHNHPIHPLSHPSFILPNPQLNILQLQPTPLLLTQIQK
ncbi:hypothetical protein, partial [Staphylococcus epidermidis]|uniref:hypothetical protein n=1 Tax=Staphylococcus epidermidis TaxID=1282 RepID=UPI0037DA3926